VANFRRYEGFTRYQKARARLMARLREGCTFAYHIVSAVDALIARSEHGADIMSCGHVDVRTVVTLVTPLSENPNIEPRFPDVGLVGRLRPCCGVVDRRGRHPIEGAIPPSPPFWERV
jgi:hypothetical protein